MKTMIKFIKIYFRYWDEIIALRDESLDAVIGPYLPKWSIRFINLVTIPIDIVIITILIETGRKDILDSIINYVQLKKDLG